MRVLSLGEIMVELSGAGDGLWRQGFAGDTFNTAWYLAALRRDWSVAYGTRLGTDPLSDAAVAMIEAAGIGTDWIGRDPLRNIGAYMISLDRGERSFTYWRGQSAARGLAGDAPWLRDACDQADVIYFSGITLAILPDEGRDRLLQVLAGRKVVFDPNIRPRLWDSRVDMQSWLTRAASVSSILLPSFDDETSAFDDTDPQATAMRYAKLGVPEVVVKNGAGPLTLWHDGPQTVPAPIAVPPVDTTGAGDSFNAGYLAARLGGKDPVSAVRQGQALAAMVVQHRGALMPQNRITLEGALPC